MTYSEAIVLGCSSVLYIWCVFCPDSDRKLISQGQGDMDRIAGQVEIFVMV